MKIIIQDNYNNEINYFSLKSISDCERYLSQFKKFDKECTSTLHLYEKRLTYEDLIEIKNVLSKSNIQLRNILTNSRETLISAKFLKLNANLNVNIKFNCDNRFNKDINNITHKGTVRSGDKISSNGNLCIIGDVNPGSQISAKKNIYVWGKLSGVAIAGQNGDDNCTIASLYLNPVQLRINKTFAMGPKEKPNNNYPEIAFLEGDKIVIKPLLMNK